jgi:hypothetical protein
MLGSQCRVDAFKGGIRVWHFELSGRASEEEVAYTVPVWFVCRLIVSAHVEANDSAVSGISASNSDLDAAGE